MGVGSIVGWSYAQGPWRLRWLALDKIGEDEVANFYSRSRERGDGAYRSCSVEAAVANRRQELTRGRRIRQHGGKDGELAKERTWLVRVLGCSVDVLDCRTCRASIGPG